MTTHHINETEAIDRNSHGANQHAAQSDFQNVDSRVNQRYVTENSTLKRKLITQRRSNLDLRRQIQKLKKQNLRLGTRLNRIRSLETLELNVRLLKTSLASSDARV